MAVKWDVLEASVRGASHEHNGTPNQDAVATRISPDGRVAIVAISDGHGGRRYVRSNLGSQFAVEIASETLSEWWNERRDTRVTDADAVIRELRDDVAPLIARRWRARVEAHVNAHSFSEEERRTADAPLETQPNVAYGATLLAALASDRLVAFAQLGDGDIVVVRGDDVSLPIAHDARLVAGQTTSLCLDSAESDFRCAVLGDIEQFKLVLMSTDGYANSFADDDWEHTVGTDIAARVASVGADVVGRQLPAWVGDSAAASGDDTSVVLLIPGASEPVPAGADRAPGRPGRRLVLFSLSTLVLGLVAGWFWGNAASSGSTPTRRLPPVPVTSGTTLGGAPSTARATLIGSAGVAVAFDTDRRNPAPTRVPAPAVAAIVTRLRVGDTVWDVTANGDVSATADATGQVAIVPVGITASALSFAGNTLWAIDGGGTKLVAIDPATHAALPPVPISAQEGVVGGGASATSATPATGG